MLHQPLVIEERHGGIFDISEDKLIYQADLQRHGRKPGDKDDLAGVKKIWWQELEGKVRLDQPRGGH